MSFLPYPAPIPATQEMVTMQRPVRDLTARVTRLDRPARGLAKEVGLQRGAGGVLLARERKQYLRATQQALAVGDEARVVLAGGVKRLEGG
jgi:hypothetical protein